MAQISLILPTEYTTCKLVPMLIGLYQLRGGYGDAPLAYGTTSINKKMPAFYYTVSYP